MFDFLFQFFSDYGYIAVFGMLILCGFGLPVPEDITLVTGGVIAGLGMGNPHVMLAVGLAGVLIGDSTMFLGGHIFGYRIQRIRLFRRILPPQRFSQIQVQFKRHGLGLLFVARFLPGLRSPIFMVAGMSQRIAYLTFIAMDGMAALISVPVWIYLGYFFADNLDVLWEHVHNVQHLIFGLLGLLLIVIVAILIKRKVKARMSSKLGVDEGKGQD
ncbi:MAG: DedA family protein [Succinivibrionaceae bacterium]|nr:DedA family protein [Succinivibrionaceae bacterium]